MSYLALVIKKIVTDLGGLLGPYPRKELHMVFNYLTTSKKQPSPLPRPTRKRLCRFTHCP
jgi:hypothetical protein